MFVEKPFFKKPGDQNVKIWRYMDFTKFIDLLDSSELYFSKPSGFSDPFEGSLTKKTSERISNWYAENNVVPGQREEFSLMLKSHQSVIGINCWHMNSHESEAMWKLYLNGGFGVAITSTYKRLTECFKVTERNVYVSEINYVDYDTYDLPGEEGNIGLYDPFIHKRLSFVHEKELRAIVLHERFEKSKWSGLSRNYPTDSFADGQPGYRERCCLSTLIQEVVISPSAPDWFVRLIENCLRRFGYNFCIKQSKIYSTPTY